MTALSASGDGKRAQGHSGQAYKDKSKPTDIRSSNINAAKGIIDFAGEKYFRIDDETKKIYIVFGAHPSLHRFPVERDDKCYHLWA